MRRGRAGGLLSLRLLALAALPGRADAAAQTGVGAQLVYIVLQIEESARFCHITLDRKRQTKLAAILRRIARKSGADGPDEIAATRAALAEEYRAASPEACSAADPAAELARAVNDISY